MHGCIARIVFGLAVVAFPLSWAQAQAESVSDQIERLIAKSGRATQIAVVARDLNDGSALVAHNADTALKPASVLKLFATSAALLRFGLEFQFQTAVFLRGDELWVIGSGDPAIGDERIADRNGRPVSAFLDDCARALAGRRVTRIVLDDSIFDDQIRNPAWPADQNLAWYQAPVGGLNYNDNCLDARVSVANGNVSLRLIPPLPSEFIHNTLRANTQHKPVLRRDADSDVFEFTGPIAKSGEMGPIAAYRPTVFFGHALRKALETAGVGTNIEVVRRTIASQDITAAGTPLLAQRTPLRDAVWRANTFSQNLFAECIAKSLAAYEPNGKRSGRPGSWPAGIAIERETLARIGADLSGATIVDGSGLSHENRVTAGQVVALLRAMHRQPQGAAFADSLADAGDEGTLRHKRDPALVGKLRAKTGTLKGVHALAGYLTRDDGTTLAFAVLVNGEGGADLPIQIARLLAR